MYVVVVVVCVDPCEMLRTCFATKLRAMACAHKTDAGKAVGFAMSCKDGFKHCAQDVVVCHTQGTTGDNRASRGCVDAMVDGLTPPCHLFGENFDQIFQALFEGAVCGTWFPENGRRLKKIDEWQTVGSASLCHRQVRRTHRSPMIAMRSVTAQEKCQTGYCANSLRGKRNAV